MAKPLTYRHKCVVLDRVKLSEQDLILVLLTDTGSQLTAVAKGARKSGSKLSARCDYFCMSDFLFRQSKAPLPYVTEANLIQIYPSLRSIPEHMQAASAALEIARMTSFEDSEDPIAFAMVIRLFECMDEANTQEQLEMLLSGYVFKILAHKGWLVQTSVCTNCNSEDVTSFSCINGGVMCGECTENVLDIEAITQEQIQWIDYVLNSTFEEILNTQITTEMSMWLVGLAYRWASTHLDNRLYAMQFMLGIV